MKTRLLCVTNNDLSLVVFGEVGLILKLAERRSLQVLTELRVDYVDPLNRYSIQLTAVFVDA